MAPDSRGSDLDSLIAPCDLRIGTLAFSDCFCTSKMRAMAAP